MTEIKLYEFLGIKRFRLLVFKLEKFIHRNDHGKNINYHIQTKNPRGLEAFKKYLYYNGAIHIRNIIFICVFYLVRWFLKKPLHLYDIFIIVFLIKDLYCVMLQRYNHLRIRQHLVNLKERQKRILHQRASQISFCEYSKDEIAQAVMLLTRMRRAISEQECIIITDKDIPILQKLSKTIHIGSTTV